MNVNVSMAEDCRCLSNVSSFLCLYQDYELMHKVGYLIRCHFEMLTERNKTPDRCCVVLNIF